MDRKWNVWDIYDIEIGKKRLFMSDSGEKLSGPSDVCRGKGRILQYIRYSLGVNEVPFYSMLLKVRSSKKVDYTFLGFRQLVYYVLHTYIVVFSITLFIILRYVWYCFYARYIFVIIKRLSETRKFLIESGKMQAAILHTHL